MTHDGGSFTDHTDGSSGDGRDDGSALGDALGGVVSGGDTERSLGSSLLALTRLLATSARVAGAKAVVRGRWLADTFVDAAPRIPVRDAETLSTHHHGLVGEALADALVDTAVKGTAAVGAAGGALAAVEFAAPPMLLGAPAQIAAETIAMAAIEVKLLAELHEVYGFPAPGDGTQRAVAYVEAWVHRRGIDPSQPGAFRGALGQGLRRGVQRRLVGRAGRNLATLGPLLTGAVAGAALNRRETRRMSEVVRADLRRRRLRER